MCANDDKVDVKSMLPQSIGSFRPLRWSALNHRFHARRSRGTVTTQPRPRPHAHTTLHHTNHTNHTIPHKKRHATAYPDAMPSRGQDPSRKRKPFRARRRLKIRALEPSAGDLEHDSKMLSVLCALGDGQSMLTLAWLKRRHPERYRHVLICCGNFHQFGHFMFGAHESFYSCFTCYRLEQAL
jgi:hypothetical protein